MKPANWPFPWGHGPDFQPTKIGVNMIMIQASERFLSFNGDSETALYLVESIREAYGHTDMPKMLNDFIFNIEVALQNAGVLDEHFNQI